MEYLAHHGIKGQKWGVRRYQNPDGSLTDEGRRRYGYGAYETYKGRKYIENYDKGLSSFERREGRSRNPSKKVHLV